MDTQLVYADIGPSSFQRPKMMLSTLELDDSRVKYAQLNYNAIHDCSDSQERNSLTETNFQLNDKSKI